MFVKQEVGSDKDGQIVFYGTELKEGEEKTVPPKKLIEQTFVYIAVQVDYDPTHPALSYPLSNPPQGEPLFQVPYMVKDPATQKDKVNFFYLPSARGKGQEVWTRWKEGMPLYASHVRLVEEVRKFRKLEEQDQVEKGDLLALINPDQAVTDLRQKNAKLNTAEADRMSSEKTRDEASERLRILKELNAKTPGAVSPEEMRAGELNEHRYMQEELAKRAAVRAAEYDIVAAMKVVSLHEVRSAIPGIVKTITKNRGDVIKANQDNLMQLVNPVAAAGRGSGRRPGRAEAQEGRPRLARGVPARDAADDPGSCQRRQSMRSPSPMATAPRKSRA